MANENKWEYDYSNIYNRPATQGNYVNAGSSGTNMANQSEASGYYTQPAQPTQPVQPMQGAQPAAPAQSAPQGTQNMPTGAVGGMPPPPQYQNVAPNRAAQPKTKKQKSKGKHLFTTVCSLALVGAVGFAGGYVGNLYASKNHPADPTVVVQQVLRDTSEATALSTSTNGKDLSFVSAASLASESVVVITTEQMVATSGWYGTQSVQSGAGSGVIISQDGYILTCAHVVNDASNIIVTLGDVDYAAQLIGSDEETDIAVVKIDATGLTAAVLGDSDALAVGETVIAVGNPLGELGGSVTSGIVSALNRVIVVENYEMTLIQMDASVSPGNSGGGLFNMAGELVGIVNAKSKDSDSEGIGFSIPVNEAFELATSLIENGYVTGRPALGLVVVSIADAETAATYGVNGFGVYVYSINEGSAAQQAGLQVGDRLVSVDDTEISELADLTNAFDAKGVGAEITLLVARNGQMLTIKATLDEQGAPSSTPQTAMPQAQDTTPEQSMEPEENEDAAVPGFPYEMFD